MSRMGCLPLETSEAESSATDTAGQRRNEGRRTSHRILQPLGIEWPLWVDFSRWRQAEIGQKRPFEGVTNLGTIQFMHYVGQHQKLIPKPTEGTSQFFYIWLCSGHK